MGDGRSVCCALLTGDSSQGRVMASPEGEFCVCLRDMVCEEAKGGGRRCGSEAGMENGGVGAGLEPTAGWNERFPVLWGEPQ